MGEKASQIVLKRFRKALKPEKQFTEGIHVKIIQLKMIKPITGMDNYHLHTRLNRLQILPKVILSVGMPQPPQQPGVADGKATATAGHSHSAKPGPLRTELT